MPPGRRRGAGGRRRWRGRSPGLAGLALVPGFRLALLATSGLPEAQGLTAAAAAVLLAAVSSAAVGAVLASRRPGHPVRSWSRCGPGGLRRRVPSCRPALIRKCIHVQLREYMDAGRAHRQGAGSLQPYQYARGAQASALALTAVPTSERVEVLE